MAGSTIGEASARHGVPEHVLRHWEDVGALRPDRTGSGHRRYHEAHHSQIELIQCGKAAGLSLDEIAMMLHGPVDEREPVLMGRLRELQKKALDIEASIRMLSHVAACDAVVECTKCSHPRASFRFSMEI